MQIASGRANPRFVLSPDDTAEVHRLFEQELAGDDAATVPTVPKLGYSGFIVYESGAHGSAAPPGFWRPALRVVDGVATALTGRYAGASRRSFALERHLIDAARRANLGPVLDNALRTHGGNDHE